jgi:hypothetical protein
MNEIHNMIGAAIVDALTNYCSLSALAATASAYAAILIRQGKLQQDPVKERIALLVHPGDPSDTSETPEWRDKMAGEEGDKDWIPESHEIGGGEFWWRKFTVEMDVYLVKTREERAEAREISEWVFGRAHKALTDLSGINLTDDFGEEAFYLTVDSVTFRESGGPPSTFIWKGKIRFRVLTEKM